MNQEQTELANKCIVRAKALTRMYRRPDPPFDLAELCSAYRVLEIRERPLTGDARLYAEKDGFVIELNSIFPRVRRRLSLAHEIGHLIINECSGRDLRYDGHSDAECENLCTQIGCELLVPDWAMKRHLDSNPVFEDWEFINRGNCSPGG